MYIRSSSCQPKGACAQADCVSTLGSHLHAHAHRHTYS